MAVISTLRRKGNNVIKSKNSTLKNIGVYKTNYHFARSNEVASNICEDAVNEPMVDMQVSGNSSQDGTSTPEQPCEIISVGEKTKNLVDVNSSTNTFGYLTKTGEVVNHTSIKYTDYIIIPNNATKLTISGMGGAVFSAPATCFYDENRNFIVGELFNETATRTFTIPSGAKYFRTCFRTTHTKFMAEYNTTATEYEPYGYKILITPKGENMVDLSKKPNENSSSYTFSNGVYTVSNSQAYRPNRWKIVLKPNTKYIVTAKSINASKCFIQISGYLSGTSIAEGSINLRDYSLTNTFTTTDNGAITLSIYTSELVESLIVEDVQIREVLETTNIYLKEPLRNIGDYADILDYKGKKVIRKIASEFITNVQTMSGDATTYRKFLTDIKYKPLLLGVSVESKGFAISNKFKQSTVTYKEMGSYPNLIQTYITTGGVNRCVYTFDDKSVQQTSQAQPLIGDGFEICYVMADTIEETIDIPEISTFDGTTTLDIETTIEPSAIKINYWKQI